MHKQRNVSIAVIFAAFALVAGLMFAGNGVTAQDEGTPDAMDGMMMGADHPGHIHTGTCDEVGDVIFPLNNLVSPDMGSPEAEMDESDDADMGTPDDAAAMDDMHGDVVAESTTTVETTFDELMAAEHVINLHESVENIGNYIACGALTGEASAEGELTIELDEMNDSGYDGHAMLVDNGDGTIDVTVQLFMVMDMGSPVASPTS